MNLEYFRLISRIASLDVEAQAIECEANIPTESTIFEGHFPGHPLMPGVLLIEAMAQASGWLILGVKRFSAMPLLASVKEAKLRSFITPGTKLRVHAKLQHEGSGFAVTDAHIKRDERVACNAEITFRLMPFPNEVFLANLKDVARGIQFPFETVDNG